jgi:branched-subunit amino acid ABC-type transport system permease component
MFELPILAQILWTSFATSSYLVLFTLAFALVVKVNQVFNFAQAGAMTVAFYAAYSVVNWAEGPGWLGVAAAFASAMLISMVFELVGFRVLRHRRASPMFVFAFTLVTSELIAYVAMLVFGTWPLTIFPSMFWPAEFVGGIGISQWDLPAIASTLAAVAMLFSFLRVSRTGQCMIAVADNPSLAELYGINRNRIYTASLAIAGLLIGLGMFLYGSRSQVQPASSIDLMLFAVIATIIGGIGNLWGAAISALLLAILQNAAVLFVPSQLQGLLLYIVLFAAIIFFPSGIKLPDRRRLIRRTSAPALKPEKT